MHLTNKTTDDMLILAQQPLASTVEVEISSEMIEAGVAIYLGFCPASGVGDTLDRKMLLRYSGRCWKLGRVDSFFIGE